MAIRKILTEPDPFLRQKSHEVNEVNKDIPRTTLQSLTDTWDEENSV